MHPLWLVASLIAQAPNAQPPGAHLVEPPPTRLEECTNLNLPTQVLDPHVVRCDGRLYFDGELAGIGTQADLDRWQKQRPSIAKHTFRSAEGFGKVKWGSSQTDVKRAYPKVKVSKDALEIREPVDGQPATVRFQFVDAQLAQVRVQFDALPNGKGVGEAMDEIKQKLADKLGPNDQGHWETPASRIDLTFANVGESVAVQVEYVSRELAFLEQPKVAAPTEPEPGSIQTL